MSIPIPISIPDALLRAIGKSPHSSTTNAVAKPFCSRNRFQIKSFTSPSPFPSPSPSPSPLARRPVNNVAKFATVEFDTGEYLKNSKTECFVSISISISIEFHCSSNETVLGMDRKKCILDTDLKSKIMTSGVWSSRVTPPNQPCVSARLKTSGRVWVTTWKFSKPSQ